MAAWKRRGWRGLEARQVGKRENDSEKKVTNEGEGGAQNGDVNAGRGAYGVFTAFLTTFSADFTR